MKFNETIMNTCAEDPTQLWRFALGGGGVGEGAKLHL